MALQKKENILFAGILLTVIVALPLVASENIDCKGKAFHCVNSTHFKICVDLGGGVSTTVDDFLIPCPGNTVCKDDNNFECEYQITTILAPITQSDVTNDAGEENFTTVENFEVTTLSSDNKPSKLQEIRDDQNSMFTVEELNSNVASVNILNESFKFADVTTEPVKFNSVISFKSDNLSESATASSFQTLSVELLTDNSFSTTSEKVILSNNATNEKSIDKNLDLSFFQNDTYNLSQSSSNSLNNGTNNFDNKVSLQFETSTLKDTLNNTNNTVDVINLTTVETSYNDDIYDYIQLTAPTSHIINETNIVTTEEITDFEQLSTTLSSESHSGGISLKSLDSYNEKESNTTQIPNTTSNLFESFNDELESTTSVNNLIKTINTINEVITEQDVDLNSNDLPKTSGTDFEINNETDNIGKINHIKTNNDNVLTLVNTITLTTEKIQTASINISTFNATERKQKRNDFESTLPAIVESEFEVNNYTFMDEKINDNYNKDFSTVTNTEKYSSSSFSQTFTEFKTTDINTIDIKQTTVIYPLTNSPALVKNESEPNTEDPYKIIVNTEKYKQYTEAPTTLSHYSSTTVPEAVSLTNITTSNIEPTSVVDSASFTTLIPINYKQLQSNSDITLIERSTTFRPETYNDDVSMKNSDSNYSTTNFNTDISKTTTTKEALESSTNNEFFTIASEQELFESTYLEKGTTERYELESQVTNKQPLTENESIFLAGQQLSYDISDRRIFLQLNNSQLSDSEILENESSNITDLHSKISNNLNVIERNKSDKILRMSSSSPNLASYDKISNSTNTTTDPKLMGVNKNLNTLNADINYSSDNTTSNNINDIEKLEHLANNISTNIKSLENIKSNTTELKSVNIDINRIPPKVKPIYMDKFIESSVTEIILPLEPTSTTEAYFTQNEKHFGIMDNVNTTLDVIGFSTTEDIRKNDGNFSEGVTELFEFSSNVSKYNNNSRLDLNLSNNSMTFQNGQENRKKKFIEYFSLPNITSANETVGNGISINDINAIDKAYIESFNSEDPSFLNSKVASSKLSNDTFNSLQSSIAENNLLIENFKNFDVTVVEAPYIQTEKQSLSDINALPSNNAVNYTTTTTAILTKKDIKGNVTNEVTVSDEHNLHNFTKNVPKFISNIINEFGLEKNTLNRENKYNLTSTEFENLLNKSSEVKLKHNVPSQDLIGIIEEENILHNTSILDTEYGAGTSKNHSTNIDNLSTFSPINNTIQDNINQLHLSGQNIERQTQNFFSPPINIHETFVAMKNTNRTNNIFSLNNSVGLSVPQYPLKNRPSLKDIEEGQIKTNDVVSTTIKFETDAKDATKIQSNLKTLISPIYFQNNTESTKTKLENNSSVPKLHRENETLHVNQVLVTMNNNTVDILNSTITKVTDLLNADISSQTFKNSSNDNLLENPKIFISNGSKNKSLTDENFSTVSFTEKTTKDTISGYNDTIENSVTDLLNADIPSQTLKNSSTDNLLKNHKIFISNGSKHKSLQDENIYTVSFTEKTTKDTNSGYNDTIENSVVKQNIVKVNFTSPKQIISQSNLLLANYSQVKISLQDKVNKSFEKSSAKVFSMNETNVTEMKGLIQFDCLNRSRGKYSDEKNCRNFYICVGKHEPITGTCPVGTVFSELNKQCTKNLSHCIRNNQFKCLSAGRFIDILSQEFYYICVKKPNGYVRYKLQCQKGYYLDKANIQCTLNSENSKESSTNTSDRSTNERKSSESLSSNNEEKFKCKKEGKFEYPDDCRKYYVCTERNENEFRRKIKKCDSDKVFNREKRKCVDADSYES